MDGWVGVYMETSFIRAGSGPETLQEQGRSCPKDKLGWACDWHRAGHSLKALSCPSRAAGRCLRSHLQPRDLSHPITSTSPLLDALQGAAAAGGMTLASPPAPLAQPPGPMGPAPTPTENRAAPGRPTLGACAEAAAGRFPPSPPQLCSWFSGMLRPHWESKGHWSGGKPIPEKPPPIPWHRRRRRVVWH